MLASPFGWCFETTLENPEFWYFQILGPFLKMVTSDEDFSNKISSDVDRQPFTGPHIYGETYSCFDHTVLHHHYSYGGNNGGTIGLHGIKATTRFSPVNNAGAMEMAGDATLKKSLLLKSSSDVTIFKVDQESGNTEIQGSLNVVSKRTTLNGDVTLGGSTSDSITSKGNLFAFGTNDLTGKRISRT